jgi:hypothetical protein
MREGTVWSGQVAIPGDKSPSRQRTEAPARGGLFCRLHQFRQRVGHDRGATSVGRDLGRGRGAPSSATPFACHGTSATTLHEFPRCRIEVRREASRELDEAALHQQGGKRCYGKRRPPVTVVEKCSPAEHRLPCSARSRAGRSPWSAGRGRLHRGRPCEDP